jgi:lipopolysaccharide/colanic/teichoic acid biosynthesis glycosyltransferase
MHNKTTPIFKRIVDLILATVLIILLSPLFILSAILVILDGTGGSILSTSPKRLGRNGKRFRMLKFRSMIPNAHNIIKQKKFRDLRRRQMSGCFKIDGSTDPRITRSGRVLRFFDLDELPQFFNVLRGEMSIVGPRPYIEEEVRMLINRNPELQKSFALITSVRPGITGLWQVSGRNDLLMSDRIRLDVQYVKNKSILKDLLIMLKTPWVIMIRKGAK